MWWRGSTAPNALQADPEGTWIRRSTGRLRSPNGIVLLGDYDVRLEGFGARRRRRASEPLVRRCPWKQRSLDGFLIAFALAISTLFYGWLWELA
jgi:hypothetical protein